MESVLRALAETFFPGTNNTDLDQAQNSAYSRLNGAAFPQVIPQVSKCIMQQQLAGSKTACADPTKLLCLSPHVLQVLRVIDVQLYGPSKTKLKL
jgi:hypothetical protein